MILSIRYDKSATILHPGNWTGCVARALQDRGVLGAQSNRFGSSYGAQPGNLSVPTSAGAKILM